MYKIILTLMTSLFLLLLLFQNSALAATRPVVVHPPTSITVMDVEDGDTQLVKFAQTGALAVIRDACLDTPEIPHSQKDAALKDQNAISQFKWGLAAKTFVTQLVKSAKNIQATIVDYDLKYKRNVAQISVDGEDLGLKMVSAGYALTFPQYLDRCSNACALVLAEKLARNQKLGMHSEPVPVMVPADFRKAITKMQ